jgi:hypothetical protein
VRDTLHLFTAVSTTAGTGPYERKPCPHPWCRPCRHLLHHLIKCPTPDSCAVCNPVDLPAPLKELRALNDGLKQSEAASAAAAAVRAHNQQQQQQYHQHFQYTCTQLQYPQQQQQSAVQQQQQHIQQHQQQPQQPQQQRAITTAPAAY